MAESTVAGSAGVHSATAAVAELMGSADPSPVEAARAFGDAEVEQRLADLDELLARVEEIPGPAGELAVEAVAALAEVYGAALTRAMAYVSSAVPAAISGTSSLVDAFTGDDLLGHLLVLHGIHPEPAEQRIARALEDARAALGSSGGEVTFLGITQGPEGRIAEVRVPSDGGGCGSGCGCSSSGGVEDVVRDVVLAAAPELVEVRLVSAGVTRPATFIPLDSLVHAPAGLVTPR